MALVDTKSLYTNSGNATTDQANLQTNLNNILAWTDAAAAQGAEFVGFPELCLNGYAYASNMSWLSLTGPQVQAVEQKALQKGIYISVGLAELDSQGKKWNTQIVVNPAGQIVGWHHKTWLTSEVGYTSTGTDHNVFAVKGGIKMGISTCADGTDYYNLKALVDNGADIIYGPHANTTGSTIQGWYNFRAKWGGTYPGTWSNQTTSNNGPAATMPNGGWIDYLSDYSGRPVYAALHNNAAWYAPPRSGEPSMNWAAGNWFIAPDGTTLARESPTSPADANGHTTYENMLIYNLPIPEPVTLTLLAAGGVMLSRRRRA